MGALVLGACALVGVLDVTLDVCVLVAADAVWLALVEEDGDFEPEPPHPASVSISISAALTAMFSSRPIDVPS